MFQAPNGKVWFPGFKDMPGTLPMTIVPGFDLCKADLRDEAAARSRPYQLLAPAQAGYYTTDTRGKNYLILWGGIMNTTLRTEDDDHQE